MDLSPLFNYISKIDIKDVKSINNINNVINDPSLLLCLFDRHSMNGNRICLSGDLIVGFIAKEKT